MRPELRIVGGETPRQRSQRALLSTEQMLREALAELDMVEQLRRETLAIVDRLRRRWRDENPGHFMLPSIEQLRREIDAGGRA